MLVSLGSMMSQSILPQKRFYRQRPHCNPLSDNVFDHPKNPDAVEWLQLYPGWIPGTSRVDFCDVGCGYGGLVMTLAKLFPDKNVLGMEIRDKVSEYVRQKILGLRKLAADGQSDEQPAHHYSNAAVVRTNSMKYLPNYIAKGSLSKLFFLFPDPHFKRSKFRWRIVSRQTLDVYAYVLATGAIVYTITDVEDLHVWMRDHFRVHPLFAEIVDTDELQRDPVVPLLPTCTEEGCKVQRNGGKTFLAVFRRVAFTPPTTSNVPTETVAASQ